MSMQEIYSYILFFSIFTLVVVALVITLSKNDEYLKIVVFFIIPILSASVTSTRSLFLTESDDFIRYYELYLLYGSSSQQYNYLFIKEPLFQGLNILLFNLFGEISPRNLMFIYSLVTSSFVSLYFMRSVDKRYNIISCVFFLITPQFLIADSQLIRQVMSTSIFMFSLSLKNHKYKIIFMMFSFFTHYFTVVFYAFFVLLCKLIRTKRFLIVYLFTIVTVGQLFHLIVTHFSGYLKQIPMIGSKLVYLLELTNGQTASLGMYHVLFLLLFILFIFLNDFYAIKENNIFMFSLSGITFFFLLSFDQRIASRFNYLFLPFLALFTYSIMFKINIKGKEVHSSNYVSIINSSFRYVSLMIPTLMMLLFYYHIFSLNHDFSLFYRILL